MTGRCARDNSGVSKLLVGNRTKQVNVRVSFGDEPDLARYCDALAVLGPSVPIKIKSFLCCSEHANVGKECANHDACAALPSLAVDDRHVTGKNPKKGGREVQRVSSQ